MGKLLEELVGTRLKVHWHFDKKTYSISTYDRERKGWRVVRNNNGIQVLVPNLKLRNAEFKVSPAGKKRAIEQGQRNVHAFVVGTLVDFSLGHSHNPYAYTQGMMVLYSPFSYEEPEFKCLPIGYEDYYSSKSLDEWPGIYKAETLYLGRNDYIARPIMVARGLIDHS